MASPEQPRIGKHDDYPVSEASTTDVLDHVLGYGDPEKPSPTIREFTTSAMAEGAIDGTADDYRMAAARHTDFKYSCFSDKKQLMTPILK
eukprot:6210716-Pleurochrysis_carterae.AAC.1